MREEKRGREESGGQCTELWTKESNEKSSRKKKGEQKRPNIVHIIALINDHIISCGCFVNNMNYLKIIVTSRILSSNL